MTSSHFFPALASLALLAVTPNVIAADIANIPKPFVVAPLCTAEERSAAVELSRLNEPVAACFRLEKWSFKGVALAVEPESYAGKATSPEEFRQLRKRIFRDQSVRLRVERNLQDALPDQPPSHASIPLSLFVKVRTPLGVFLDESQHVGFADLIPISNRTGYPLIQLETWVLSKGQVFKLVQIAPITGPSTIGEGYHMADDWARRFNGSERLATED